jgi:hypothetical protein
VDSQKDDVEQRRSRIRELKRQMRAKASTPRLLERLREDFRLGVGVNNLVSIDDTQRLKPIAFKRSASRQAYRQEWLVPDKAACFQALEPIASKTESLEVVLFHPDDETTGAIVVPAGAVLRGSKAWDLELSDLFIITKDGATGLRLEFNYYDWRDRYVKDGVLQLTAWGQLSPK